METMLIIGIAAVATLTVILTLVGIVLIEVLEGPTHALKKWLRQFKPRRRPALQQPSTFLMA